MADMPLLELLGKIQEQYPQYLYLLQQPGVFKIIADSLNHPEEWPPARFDAELLKTPYFQDTTEEARRFDLLRVTDPATARKKVQSTKQIIEDLETSLGVSLSNEGGFGSMKFTFMARAAAENWTPEEIKYNLLASVNKTVTGGGDLGAISAKVKKQMDDYGVPMSDQAILGWATKLSQGAVDDAAVLGYAQQSAMSLFPGLKDAISRGVTVRQYADPYLQIAQQELGTNPDTVSFTDPRWMRALNNIDPKTGQRLSMSLTDWTSLIRSDATYGYDNTEKANTQAAEFGSRLGKMMGAV